MRQGTWIVAALVLLTSVSFAQDKPASAPKSPAAVQAIKKSEIAIQRAEDAYRQAKLAALKQLVADLKGAMANATRAGSLDEANAIKAAMDQAQGDIDLIAISGKAQRFVVKANEDWQYACPVQAGEAITIKVSGLWRGMPSHKPFGADGHENGKYYLEGRIGEGGVPFRVGSNYQAKAEADGVLQLRMNDGVHGDNEGSVTASVTVER